MLDERGTDLYLVLICFGGTKNFRGENLPFVVCDSPHIRGTAGHRVVAGLEQFAGEVMGWGQNSPQPTRLSQTPQRLLSKALGINPGINNLKGVT